MDLFLIDGSSGSSSRSHIADFQTAKDMWLYLTKHFIQSSEAREYEVSRAIQNAE